MANHKRGRRLNMRGQLKLVPGYLVLSAWVSFTFVVIFWVIGASLSTTGDIFRGTIFDFSTGLHFENYSRAWIGSNVAVYFTNSLIYAVVSCTLLILLCAPFAYVLVRHRFFCSQLIKTGLAAASGVPIIMVIIPLYMIIARAGLLKDEMSNRIVLITLFVGTKVPYTTIFLQPYFDSVSRAYEEAASIDGCHPLIGHYMLIWLSGMERVSPDLYEASSIDGASKVQQFFHITLPLLRSMLKTNLTMWAISCSGFFIWSKLFSPITADTSTIVPMIYMYEKLFGAANTDEVTRDAGSAAAIGVMLCIFVVVMFLLTNKAIKDDDIEI